MNLRRRLGGATKPVAAALLFSFTAVPVTVAQASRANDGTAGALVLLDRGDGPAAREGLRLAAAEAQFHLALAETEGARESALQQALALAPEGSWVIPAAVGLRALSAEKPAEAVASLREALTKRQDARVQKLLGDALREQSDRSGALEAYTAASRLAPSYATALLGVGDLQRERNDFAAAFNAYNHAVDEEGRPANALLGRAAARLHLGDREGVLADLARAVETARSAPERARAELARVWAHTYWRSLPEAMDAAERAVAIWEEAGRPDAAASTCNAIGRALLESGSSDAAAQWYDRGWNLVDASAMKAEERVVWRVRYLHASARIAAQRRETRRTAALVAEVRQLMDGDVANAEHYRTIYPYLLGYIRFQERKYDEAIALLQQAETDRPFIQYLIAESYARSRDRESARSWYDRVLASATGLDVESAVARPEALAWLAKNPSGS